MRPRKLYWVEVQVGETLPPLVKEPVTRVQLVKYAGASGDFNPLHVDDVHAREVGMPGVCAPGMLVMGFIGQLVTGWAGVHGKVRDLGSRFVKIVWPGDVVTCCGRVVGLDHQEGDYTVSLDLWAENQRGELVVKGSAVIQLYHSIKDEELQARGEGPLVAEEKPPPPLQERIGAPLEPVRAISIAQGRRAASSGRVVGGRPRRLVKEKRADRGESRRQKAAPKKAAPKKAAPKKAAPKKAAPKKAAPKKALPKKAAPKKAAPKKAAPKKAAPKKAAPKKAVVTRSAAKQAKSGKPGARKK